jgi:hypothetical protein
VLAGLGAQRFEQEVEEFPVGLEGAHCWVLLDSGGRRVPQNEAGR